MTREKNNELMNYKLFRFNRKCNRGRYYDHPNQCLWGELPEDFVPIKDFHIEKENVTTSMWFDKIYNGDFRFGDLSKKKRR